MDWLRIETSFPNQKIEELVRYIVKHSWYVELYCAERIINIGMKFYSTTTTVFPYADIRLGSTVIVGIIIAHVGFVEYSVVAFNDR